MKYKIIKKFPFFCTLDKVIETNDANLIKLIGSNLYIDPENWPEYFEPVKEPLFISTDGFEIFEAEDLWLVLLGYNENPETYKVFQVCSESSFFEHSKAEYKVFKLKENAIKWIDENKPMFSKKQISEILDKFSLGQWELWGTMKGLKNEFGI